MSGETIAPSPNPSQQASATKNKGEITVLLTSTVKMSGKKQNNDSEGKKWLFEHGDKLVRPIKSKTGRIIFLSSVLKGRKLAIKKLYVSEACYIS